ncbi:hypothetical protein [Arthrobacter sp. SPG23]|uniref:hypothetical protein n=1 Tax=Arthrobacter sp. SPG23 TaxID=1610703 RepID=UPI000A49773D|nr:hypothetical protein [Arthrobacter sp. SPG23]
MFVDHDDYTLYSVTKVKYAGKAGAWDKNRVIYNSRITLLSTPAEARRYMPG